MEDDLQINIVAVDEASGTLDSVAASAEGMANSIEQAAGTISETLGTAFTAAEEAAAEAAVASANAWNSATEEIDSAVASVVETTAGEWKNVSDAALGAASATSESWQASLEEIAAIGAMTEEEVDASFARMGASGEEAAAKSTASMGGMHGYFRMLIAGYLADTAGQSLIGAVNTAVTAAAGDPQKLAQLTDQLQQQEAALAKLELPISGKGLTTATLGADQAEQVAKIAAAKDKIQELQAQMLPLIAAQKEAGQSAKDYDAATRQLTNDWQQFLATAGTPLLEHLAHAAEAFDKVVVVVTKWTEEHPKLTETILIFMGILGGLLLVSGAILIAFAPVIILFGMFGVAITGASLAMAAAGAAIIAAIIFLVASVTANWDSISKTTITVWNSIATFIKGIWDKIVNDAQIAIGKVHSLIASIMAPINAVTGAISNIGSTIGQGASTIFNSIPHFAEGGIVNGPTMALIGEAGPEAVIPLSAFAGGLSLSGAGGGGGSGAIVINLSGNFYGSDQQMMYKLSQYLAKNIGRQIKL